MLKWWGDIRQATYLLAVVGVALGIAALTLKTQDATHSAVSTVMGGAAGFLFLGAGTVAHQRRPHNRVGLLMVLVGISWFAEDLQFATYAPLFTVGFALVHASSGFVAQLTLSFPTGRLSSRLQITLAVAAHGLAIGLTTLTALFGPPDKGPGTAPNLLMVVDDYPTVELGRSVLAVGQILVAGGILLVLIQRWRRATPPMRRVLRPVFGAGLLGTSASVVGGLAGATGPVRDIGLTTYKVAFLLFPLAFLAGILRMRLGHSPVDSLLQELKHPTSDRAIRDVLARALQDPTIQIGLWREDTGHYVDTAGSILTPEADRRAVRYVEVDGRRLAAVVHDQALNENSKLLDAVSAALTLVLAARMSRVELVATVDEQRRRIERDLHDGAQQRLVVAAMSLRQVQDQFKDDPLVCELLTVGIGNIDAALAELRDLARGIHPAILTSSGLQPAIRALADRIPMRIWVDVRAPRLPELVESTAYFVIAEALTNVLKHARATEARIMVRYGSDLEVEVSDNGLGGARIAPGQGLAGIRMRVMALGGELSLRSTPETGTTLSVRL